MSADRINLKKQTPRSEKISYYLKLEETCLSHEKT